MFEWLDVEMLNALTLAWLTGWAGLAGWKLAHGSRDTVFFAMLVFWAFFGCPLGLDAFVGAPNFDHYPGFSITSGDPTTNRIYCALVAAVPPMWWYTARTRRRVGASDFEVSTLNPRIARAVRPLLYLLLVLPLPAAVFSPRPELYLTYGLRGVHEFLANDVTEYHHVMSLLALLAILSSLTLVLLRERVTPGFLLSLMPWLVLACWIHGKRSVVAITLTLSVYAAWHRGHLRGARLLIVAVLAVSLLASFSAFYQGSVRDVMAQGSDAIYEDFRVDYGRDAVTKLAIFAELNPSKVQILEYRGQSILFNLLPYIPRAWWRAKPYPYAIYATSAVFFEAPRDLGWCVTTSCFDEAIANVGWLGLLLGPLWITLICRLGDSFDNALVRVQTLMITLLFLTVNFSVIAPIFYAWVATMAWIWNAGRRDEPVAVAPLPA